MAVANSYSHVTDRSIWVYDCKCYAEQFVFANHDEMVQGQDGRTIWQRRGDQQDDEPAVVSSCPTPSKRCRSREAGGHLQDQPGEEAE